MAAHKGYPRVDLAREPWRLLAACRDHPRLKPEAWDDSIAAEQENPLTRKRRTDAAKDVCNKECPVKAECLRDVDLEWDEGIRGGLDLRDLKGRKAS